MHTSYLATSAQTAANHRLKVTTGNNRGSGTAQAFLQTGAKLVGIVPRSVGIVVIDVDKPGGREKCREMRGEPLAEYKTHRADGWHLLYPAPTGKADKTWECGEIKCDVEQGYIIAWDTEQWCKAAQHIRDTAANLASSVDEIVSGTKTDTKFPATKLTPKSLVGLKKGHGHSIQDRIFQGAMRDAAAGRLTEARREQWQKAGVATGHTAAVLRRNIQRGEAAAKARASGIMDHELIIVGGQPRVLTPDGRELRQSALDAMFGRRNLDHWKTSKEKKVWPLGYYLDAPPRKLPDGAYGTWRKFTVEPKQGDWSLYRALLLEMVEGSEDNLRWLLNWMAHAVQLPGAPAGQCVVMASPTKWIGKSEAGYYFRNLFGPHAIEVGPARNILGEVQLPAK